MTVDLIMYSKTLENFVVINQVTYDYGSKLTLITEYGEDPVIKGGLDELATNLKLEFISLDLVCV
jgi:hypothetical protein